MKRITMLAGLLCCILIQLAVAQNIAEKIDTAIISKIKDEESNRSHAMELMSWLTDVCGSRLTGSPQYKEAAEWAKKQLGEWGLHNVQIESWEPFGRGWTLKHFSAMMTEPRTIPLIGYPKAWSPGLKGMMNANAIYLEANSEADLEKYKDRMGINPKKLYRMIWKRP